MSTLRISNIEAKSVPASATVDEKVKITNSSGDTLVFIDGKTSGITTVGINTTDGNITFDANSNVVVTGIITASKFVGTFEPTNLTLSGDLLIPDKIVHTGDTDTAIRFPAADTITAETGGGERLRITSVGNLGLGTNNPTTKLHVQQSAVTSAPSRTSALYLENNANCEIQFVGNSSNDCQLRFGTSSNSFKGAIEYELDNNNLINYTNGTERLRITSDGKLVTNSASSIDCGVGGMHLYLGDGARNDYSTAADGLIIEKNGNTGLSIDPGSSGVANIYFPNESNHSIASISHNNSNGELRVRGEDHIILSTDGNTERLRIYSDGRVAINQPTGTGVANTGKVHIKSSASNIGQIYLEQNNATDGFILNQDGPNGGHLKFIRNIGGTQTVNLLFRSDRGICFNGDTAAANALDDYEEGDHSTTVTMDGDTSFSYSSRTLAYTKIGRAVFVTGRINMTGAGGSSFRFTLPFTCGNGSFKYETSNEFQNIRFNDGYTFRIRSNTAYVDLQSDGSNTSIGTGSPHINVNIFYFTA